MIKVNFPYLLILMLLVTACSHSEKFVQSKESRQKLDSLHSGFNKKELTKEVITLNKDTITLVAFGHVYSLLHHEDVFDSMIDKINEQNPDYVWILGDIVFNNTEQEWSYLLNKYKGLQGKRFHAAGNHDMNFHYERYYGINENQWVAEQRFLSHIGYRYITLEDDVANYMMINMNDSLKRIKQYLNSMLPELNPDKPAILFTHHSVWHKSMSKADDPTSWVQKSFQRDSILAQLTDFDYLVHGDWGDKFFSGKSKYKSKKYNVIAVGNLNEGDDLYITTFKITKDSLWAYPVFVDIPDTTTWKTKVIDN